MSSIETLFETLSQIKTSTKTTVSTEIVFKETTVEGGGYIYLGTEKCLGAYDGGTGQIFKMTGTQTYKGVTTPVYQEIGRGSKTLALALLGG